MHTPEKNQTLPMVLAASIAVMLQITVPFIAFAQAEAQATEAAVAVVDPATATAPVPAESVPETPANDLVVDNPAGTAEQTTEPVQETATSTQATAGVDDLAGTVNPEDGASDAAPIPIEEASSTDPIAPEIIPLPELAPELTPEQIPVEAVSDVTVVASDISEEARELTNAELNARIEPNFVTSISGKTIPTKIRPGDAETVTTTVDPTSHDLHVSGSCDDVYYVVLLYKNQTDYELDQGSYIVNRAYPCIGGSYSYTLEDIPVSVQNGTYYLLIGAQGDKGAWRPVTELQEVTINRAN